MRSRTGARLRRTLWQPAVPPPSGQVSARVATALAASRARTIRHTARLRPTLWVVLAIVTGTAYSGQPRPGWSGERLGVGIALAGVWLTIGLAAADVWPMARAVPRAAFPVLAGGFGLLLAGLQRSNLGTVPGSLGIFCAVLMLPTVLGAVIGGLLAAGVLAVAAGPAGDSPAIAASQLTFCAVLAITALSVRQSGENQARAEVLVAQLEDAREAEARAVALAERTRIAQELHDVLAQSLSGLAIQLEVARRMARREQVGEQLQGVLDRAGGLVKEGLDDARRAVGALRGSATPALDRLPELVERFRDDHRVDVRLSVEGTPRDVPAEVGLALYRGAQEALTNVSRYAPGSPTTVTLRYAPDAVALTVVDRGGAVETHLDAGPAADGRDRDDPDRPAAPPSGSGMGLIGMRERLARVGGSAVAGAAGEGWSVHMEVPA
jgi:signal transduction histidine kinase